MSSQVAAANRFAANVTAKDLHPGMSHNGSRSRKSRIKYADAVGGGAPHEASAT